MPSWPGEVPAIHVGMPETEFAGKGRSDGRSLPGDSASCNTHVDGRDKPGHDE
jgi:hypothetical protein